MLKIERTEVGGLTAAIRGMRNPMNSWDKSDTFLFEDGMYEDIFGNSGPYSGKDFGIIVGDNDHQLMMTLARAGSVDAKFRRMIVVTADITAPLYWWKEFDTYKVGTVANSCSTMHKIHAKEFTLEDFSCEHLGFYDPEKPMEEQEYLDTTIGLGNNQAWPIDILTDIINCLNKNRVEYLVTRDKRYWWQMIQLLPSSYNQKRTVMLNYEVLAGIYPKRKNHKLDEWHTFCDWIKQLPYSEIITLEEK